MKTKKAQSSIEFIILTGFVLLFIIIFLFAMNRNLSGSLIQKRESIVSNLLMSVQDEINLASKSSNGYLREFYIPSTIDNLEYNISILEGTLYIITENKKYSSVVLVSSVVGQPKKGKNMIRNQDGIVYIN
ncbi:MAG: hypothetical protein WC494_00955 [Candidatus Pacearchaeota archaeon]